MKKKMKNISKTKKEQLRALDQTRSRVSMGRPTFFADKTKYTRKEKHKQRY